MINTVLHLEETIYTIDEYKAIVSYINKLIPKTNDTSELAKLYNDRACAYIFLKEYQNAVLDLNESLTLNPCYKMAYYNRGLAHYYLMNYNNSIHDYSESICINPDAVSYYCRGITYYVLGKFDFAVKDYTEAICLKPDFEDAKVGLKIITDIIIN